MAIEFKLPEVSEGVKTADVSDILVSEGDVIEAGQVVVEVETEKAVAPVECPHAGRVAKVHVSPGDSVPIGATLLTIEQTSEAKAPAGGGRKAPEKRSANGEKVAAPKSGDPAERAGAEEPFAGVPDPDAHPTAAEAGRKGGPAASAPAKAHAPSGGPRFSFEDEDRNGRPPAPAAPSVRRLARELGVDLHQVPGSGRGGRITADDVHAFAEGTAEPTGTGIAAPSGPKGGALAPSARGDLAPMAAPQLPDFSQYGPVTRQKMNKLARTSAANLSYAWATIPHVTQHDLADVTEIEASRKAFMAGPGAKGPKITMTAIMVKAVVAALKQHPTFNSSIDLGSGEIVLKDYYHIGIAVDTEAGLVVPVIRDADRKTILQIAAELTEIAGKARDRKLQMSDMQGGTFTITNLGGIGGTSFTPIVNYPEVAILGMSRSQTQLRLEGGQVVERLMLPLSLSYDHRVINGADAARFISTLSASLSDFMRLLVSA
ncbi:MAG TPA: 2-oxo acid dehydrogenase subunit E2 [Planctomycetaceae bacterium]